MYRDLVSIIVPVYNVEKYLNRCIDSLLNQTYKNIEIILVNDGSTDSSDKICDNYSAEDTRIRVIHKKNGGLSEARNYGIEIAKGEFISFVDSDDFVSIYYIEHLIEAIKRNDSDMSVSWFYNFLDGDICEKPVTKIENYCKLTCKQALERLLYQNGIETSAWGKLYRTCYFQSIRYPIGKLYEDIPVTVSILFNCKSIASISNKDYFYFHRRDSIQYSDFNLHKLDAIEHSKWLLEQTITKYPELRRGAESRYFSVVCNILFQIPKDTHKEIECNLWNEICKYRIHILLNHKTRLKSKIGALLSFLGYNCMKYVYSNFQVRGKRD